MGGISAGGSKTEGPDERGWTVKRGNGLGGPPCFLFIPTNPQFSTIILPSPIRSRMLLEDCGFLDLTLTEVAVQQIFQGIQQNATADDGAEEAVDVTWKQLGLFHLGVLGL